MGKAGHDLVMDAMSWHGSLAVAGEDVTLELTVDSRALKVRWGMNGTTQLTDENRESIGATIDTKVLKGAQISFRSRTATPYGNSMMMSGDLTIGSATRTINFELRTNTDGSRLDAIARITQSDFAIKPYTAMLGALKVRDVVEIVATARLPLWEAPVVWGAGELDRSDAAELDTPAADPPDDARVREPVEEEEPMPVAQLVSALTASPVTARPAAPQPPRASPAAPPPWAGRLRWSR